MAKGKNLDDDRLIKWVILPLMIIVLIIIIIIREWTIGGIVALVLLGFSYLIFTNTKYDRALIGIPKNPFQGIWFSILLAFGYLLFITIIPLAVIVPTVPQAVTEFAVGDLSVGTQLTFAIIVLLFPFAEEAWRISIITLLMKTYGWSFLAANLFQGFVLFGFVLHLLAYGVVLSAAETFGIALNQISDISGLLFSAGVFGTAAGFVLWRTRNYWATAIAHSIVNAVIISTTLAIIVL